MTGTDRPFPPGSYPVVVVGSGPGGLQLSYSLRRLGIEHAVISADEAPGGMFRKWPVFQRLLSWTKPHAAHGPGSRRFERGDWNSLLADEPELRSLQARHMDGQSSFPARAEMEANLADFAERAGIAVRYGCIWESTRRIDDGTGERFALTTSDGEYRCRVVVFAVGVAEPWTPRIPGIELAHHYADIRPASSYAGRRVFIIGKRNSGFELASGLTQWAQSITLASPSPAKTSIATKSLAGVRARYVQPFEDNALGGGCIIINAAIDGISRNGDALQVTLRYADGSLNRVEADEIINATGFVTPLRDLAAIGVATFGQSRLPAQTDWWESATVPGIYFAGTITQGAPSLGKHGIPPNSGAVQGSRYNARILARRLAEREFGRGSLARAIKTEQLTPLLVDEIDQSPELWHQYGYLGRCLVRSETGLVDVGFLPLTAFLDHGTEDGVTLTLERDGSGDIFPVLYIRRNGAIREERLSASAADGSAAPEHEAAIRSLMSELI